MFKKLPKKCEIVDIYDVMILHRGHWFSPGNKRFFKSSWTKEAIKINFDSEIAYYFISGETPPNGYRAYTIRSVSKVGCIDTVNDFMGYKSLSTAKKALLEILETSSNEEAQHVQNN
jgi:hypothetical protein